MELRQKSRNLIAKALENDVNLISRDQLEVLTRVIEKNIYEGVHDSEDKYREKVLAIFFNLKHNNTILKQLLTGEMTPSDLVEFPVKELATKDQKEKDKMIRESMINQEILEKDREDVPKRPSPEARKDGFFGI